MFKKMTGIISWPLWTQEKSVDICGFHRFV